MNSSFPQECELDYQALTAGLGSCMLSDWTNVELRGADRHQLLQNLCTNNVAQLSAGEGCEAFLTDVKGKIVAHVLVIIETERILLLTVPNQGSTIIDHLDKYIICEDVELADRSSSIDWRIVSDKLVKQLFPQAYANLSQQGASAWKHQPATLENLAVQIGRCDWLWSGNFLMRCQTEASLSLSQVLKSKEARSCQGSVHSDAPHAFHALRVESAFPLFGIDFDSANLPQEIDRDDQSICFHKGCYLGQETVARIDALGHVNQKLVVVKPSEHTEVLPASELSSEGKVVGKVTTWSWSPRLEALAGLAMVRRGYNEPGTRLLCGDLKVEVAGPVKR